MSINFLYDEALTPERLSLLTAHGRFHVRAFLLAEQFNLKSITTKRKTTEGSSVMLAVDASRVAFVFAYGIVVFFSPEDTSEPILYWQEACKPYLSGCFFDTTQEEHLTILTKAASDGFVAGTCTLSQTTRDHLELIAEVLARSLILEKHEKLLDTRFDQVKPIAKNIIAGKVHEQRHDLLQYIGANLMAEHDLAGRAAITEKPALLWENGQLEAFYHLLMDEFEIQERQSIVERKMEAISRTAQTYLDVSMHQHDLRLEWYIIILIFIEIVLEVYTIYFHI